MTATAAGLAAGEVRDFERSFPPKWPPSGVRFLRDGVVAVGGGRAIELWDVGRGEQVHAVQPPDLDRAIGVWAPAPGGDAFLIGAGEGALRLVDIDGEELQRLERTAEARAHFGSETPGLGSFTAVHHPDGSYEDRSFFYERYSVASDVAVSPHGDRAVAAYGQRYALVWRLDTGALERLVGQDAPPGSGRIYRAAWSRNGTMILTGDGSGSLRVWSAQTGREMAAFGLRNEPAGGSTSGRVGAIGFTPDSRRVVAADGAALRLWEIESRDELAPWSGHGASHPLLGDYAGMPRIQDLRFSGDGRRALTVGVDSTLRVWDVARGEQIWAVRPAPCCIDWGDISSDGSHVAWAGCPGMRVYRLD
ncbi:MAG: WD40 repeat domain-containing protein [Gemmatimonadota bacterium]